MQHTTQLPLHALVAHLARVAKYETKRGRKLPAAATTRVAAADHFPLCGRSGRAKTPGKSRGDVNGS